MSQTATLGAAIVTRIMQHHAAAVWQLEFSSGLLTCVFGPHDHAEMVSLASTAARVNKTNLRRLTYATEADLRAHFACGLDVMCI